ncbi:M20 family metallopeptidase [Aquimarina sp. MMG016]|uniref:M20 family metallopeptidase n=1 Tax=Aquimarina sp. MMG016 TaxID=2822690 RepID=UPI001B3A41C9|nr:M20 family metallopeptidase [Aquimarina sp. MMG016]MBQ4819676.1 M20 family metallopeptidase [Aquimarina sp. MMG016]
MMKIEDIARKIEKHLESCKNEMLRFLKELVTIESPSHSIISQYQIFDFIKTKFETIGYYTLHVPGNTTGGYLYARPIRREPQLPIQLVIGHCDTVWPIDTIHQMPIIDSNNTLKGPGIYDMKVGLTQMIFALSTIKELSLSLQVTPIIIINSDEEIGSRESTNAIRRLARIANRAYVLEPPLGLEGKLKTARKGVGRFTVTVKGKAAHAGLDPTKGINAIVELSHQVQQLYTMNDIQKGITVNIGMIEGGISPNVVAPESKAVVDVRVLTEADGAYITRKIKGLKPNLPDVELKIEGAIGRPPMERTIRNQELWNEAHKLGKLIDLDLEQAIAGGGSDANTTSKFTATLDGLGTPGDGAHAEHEYILYHKLVERTSLLTLLLLHEPLNC